MFWDVMLSSRRLPIIFWWRVRRQRTFQSQIQGKRQRKKVHSTLSPENHGRKEDVSGSIMLMTTRKNDESCVCSPTKVVRVEAQKPRPDRRVPPEDGTPKLSENLPSFLLRCTIEHIEQD